MILKKTVRKWHINHWEMEKIDFLRKKEKKKRKGKKKIPAKSELQHVLGDVLTKMRPKNIFLKNSFKILF